MTGAGVAAGGDDANVHVWDLHSPAATSSLLPTGTGTPWSLSFDPLGNRISAATHDGQLATWRLNGGWQKTEDQSVRTDAKLESVSVSPSGSYVAVTAADGSVRVSNVDDTTAEPVTLCCHRGDVLSVVFGPDDNVLATGGADRAVSVWDLRRPRTPTRLFDNLDASVTTVAFSASGRYLASGTDVRVENSFASVFAAAIRSAAVARSTRIVGGDVLIWDLNGRSPAPRTLGRHESKVTSVRFDPSSDRLASSSTDSRILIWSVSGSSAPDTLLGHRGTVSEIDFDPTGRNVSFRWCRWHSSFLGHEACVRRGGGARWSWRCRSVNRLHRIG